MRIFQMAPWLLAGVIAAGCAPEAATPDPLPLADAQAVIYDDETGAVEAIPVERGPEIEYTVLTPERVVIVTDVRDAHDIIDHGNPLPEPNAGLQRLVIVDPVDLAFIFDAPARWIDHDSESLFAEGDDGTIGEWPIE